MTRHERAVGHPRPSRQPEAIFKEKNYEYKGFITALLRKDYRVNSLQLQYLAHAAVLVNNGSKTGGPRCPLLHVGLSALSAQKGLVSEFSGQEGLLKAQRPDGPNWPNVESRAKPIT